MHDSYSTICIYFSNLTSGSARAILTRTFPVSIYFGLGNGIQQKRNGAMRLQSLSAALSKLLLKEIYIASKVESYISSVHVGVHASACEHCDVLGWYECS